MSNGRKINFWNYILPLFELDYKTTQHLFCGHWSDNECAGDIKCHNIAFHSKNSHDSLQANINSFSDANEFLESMQFIDGSWNENTIRLSRVSKVKRIIFIIL